MAVFLIAFYFFFQIGQVKATPSSFKISPTCATLGTLSTTSVSYMQAGKATTTATCNMMVAGAGSGTELFDMATFHVQFAGSSTASTINIDIQDSYNGVDWYPRSFGWNPESGYATSSPSLSPVQSFVYNFSSTTNDKSAVTNANSATSTRDIAIQVQAPYIRAIITMPAGSTNGAVWGTFTGKTLTP